MNVGDTVLVGGLAGLLVSVCCVVIYANSRRWLLRTYCHNSEEYMAGWKDAIASVKSRTETWVYRGDIGSKGPYGS